MSDPVILTLLFLPPILSALCLALGILWLARTPVWVLAAASLPPTAWLILSLAAGADDSVVIVYPNAVCLGVLVAAIIALLSSPRPGPPSVFLTALAFPAVWNLFTAVGGIVYYVAG